MSDSDTTYLANNAEGEANMKKDHKTLDELNDMFIAGGGTGRKG
ncbi:hypothetical protein V7295_17395 [Bacillus toyonensis]|nr:MULTISPECIES: hypothetical protein [Bacillus]